MPSARCGSARARGRRVADRVGARRWTCRRDPASAGRAEFESADVASIRADAGADVDRGDDHSRRRRDVYGAARRGQRFSGRENGRQAGHRRVGARATDGNRGGPGRLHFHVERRLSGRKSQGTGESAVTDRRWPSRPRERFAGGFASVTCDRRGPPRAENHAGGQASRDRSGTAGRRCPARVAAANPTS